MQVQHSLRLSLLRYSYLPSSLLLLEVSNSSTIRKLILSPLYVASLPILSLPHPLQDDTCATSLSFLALLEQVPNSTNRMKKAGWCKCKQGSIPVSYGSNIQSRCIGLTNCYPLSMSAVRRCSLSHI